MSGALGGRVAARLDGARSGDRPREGIAVLGELLAGETNDSRRFIRGLVLGSLVGAAIAGSSIWTRRQRARAVRDQGGGDRARPS